MNRFGDRSVVIGEGKTKYKAILCGYSVKSEELYTLVPINGGRKRHMVPRSKINLWREPLKESIQTSRGKVKVPRSLRKLPSASGGTRCAYLAKDWVWKEATSGWGLEQNAVEATMYQMQQGLKNRPEKTVEKVWNRAVRYHEQGIKVAECHLLPDGRLLMERVKTIYNLRMDPDVTDSYLRKNLPEWTYSVDSSQVGINHKGEIVAYDV